MILNYLNSNFKKIKVGDIVIAKRYNNIIEKYKIKKGHRIGPYIIISKKGYKIYALACTSKEKDNLKLSNKYNFDKQTYVNIKEIKRIKRRRIIKVIDNLDKKEMKVILKNIEKHYIKKV